MQEVKDIFHGELQSLLAEAAAYNPEIPDTESEVTVLVHGTDIESGLLQRAISRRVSPVRGGGKRVTFSPIPEVKIIPPVEVELRHELFIAGDPTTEVPLQAQTRAQ